jgi:hypothetical protein
MKHVMIATAFVLAVVGATAAQAEFMGCYERVYEARYLKKNKKQQVIRMRFQVGVGQGEDGPPELADRIEATLRGNSVYRGSAAACKVDGKELLCGITGNGGSFRVTDRGKNSVRITNTSLMRFGNEEDGDKVKADNSNREFRLFRVGKGACP